MHAVGAVFDLMVMVMVVMLSTRRLAVQTLPPRGRALPTNRQARVVECVERRRHEQQPEQALGEGQGQDQAGLALVVGVGPNRNRRVRRARGRKGREGKGRVRA